MEKDDPIEKPNPWSLKTFELESKPTISPSLNFDYFMCFPNNQGIVLKNICLEMKEYERCFALFLVLF